MTILNETMRELFVEGLIESYTILELRDLMIKRYPEFGKTKARLFIYQQSKKLVESGLLQKIKKENKRDHIYILQNELKTELAAKVGVNKLATLEEKSQTYNMELHSLIAESEEYLEICKQFPRLKVTLKKKVEGLSEFCSTLTGKIRATDYAIALLKKEGDKE